MNSPDATGTASCKQLGGPRGWIDPASQLAQVIRIVQVYKSHTTQSLLQTTSVELDVSTLPAGWASVSTAGWVDKIDRDSVDNRQYRLLTSQVVLVD